MQTVATVLVTGGAKRIGKAIVEHMAASGFQVAIHCNQSTREANQLAQKINDNGGRAHVFSADLCDKNAIDQLFLDVCNTFGAVDILVNNASIFIKDSVKNFNEELYQAHFDLHVRAPLLLSSKFANQKNLPDNSLIVNIIDQRVWSLTPSFFTYGLSKSALWTATQTMAQSFAPHIRVNAIAPGPTLANTYQDPSEFKKQTRSLLLKKGPLLNEFGSTIRYLYDTRSITGQMIALDGGQHLAFEKSDDIGDT